MYIKILILLIAINAISCQGLSLSQKDYTQDVLKLKSMIQDSSMGFKHRAYQRLAYISDTYGPRLWGSNQLEQVIAQIRQMAQSEGFDNVHYEPVGNFTKWVRGQEKLTLFSPRPSPTNLPLIGLGGSANGTVRAKAIVVSSFDELDLRKDEVRGKIVVYNQEWKGYGPTVQYRSQGASRAAKYGAVGALIRSITPESISSVHTGIMHYDANYPKIPVAAITIQDAEMMSRMQARNQTIELELSLQNQLVPNSKSNNLIFEIIGSTYPDQILLMGGHIDSWDTGSQTGANDDGGGFITVFDAMRLLIKGGFRPKRTLRFIAWSGQQWGDPKNGAHAYLNSHMNQLNKHIVAFQDDLGSTKLYGFGYSGDSKGKAIVQDICNKYLKIIGASEVSDNGQAVDTGPLRQNGVPTMINLIQDTDDHTFYFRYHHSAGDSMTIMDPDELDSNVLGVAAMFYILADLENTIPRPGLENIKRLTINE